MAAQEGAIEAIEPLFTPLQHHYLSRLRHLIALRVSYKTDPDFDAWRLSAINKGIYATVKALNL